MRVGTGCSESEGQWSVSVGLMMMMIIRACRVGTFSLPHRINERVDWGEMMGLGGGGE